MEPLASQLGGFLASLARSHPTRLVTLGPVLHCCADAWPGAVGLREAATRATACVPDCATVRKSLSCKYMELSDDECDLIFDLAGDECPDFGALEGEQPQ